MVDRLVGEEELVINPRETGPVRLDFARLFGDANRVVLEIGSGKGLFLRTAAAAMRAPW